MVFKIFYGQNKKFRMFFIICFLSLIIPCLLFATILKNRIDFRLLIINFSSDTTSIKNHEGIKHECIKHECIIEQSQKHGDLFKSFPPEWSSCYGDFYLTAFDNHSTPVEVLIDVGANKAYTVAAWLAFFLPELGVNQARLEPYIRTVKRLPESCGSCNDCRDEVLKRKNIQKKLKLQIHAFEPQPGTVDVLKDIKTWMNISARNDLTFQIHGMAVGGETGQALFKKCNAGNEVCSLDISAAVSDSQIYVNITTLDDFANQNNLSKIDIIKIDTEGYEPSVFHGAKRLLQEHRIRLFIFEHLIEGTWRNTSLEIEVSNLSKLGYICYIIGKTGLIRVTNCWNQQFDVRHNNLLCVSSKDNRLSYDIDQMRVPKSIANTC